MNQRKSQRGSALILAILVMFSMVALGVLAMRSTGQNIRSAGNLRLTKQVRQVAEAGLYHAITVMNREGPSIMPLRDDPALKDSIFTMVSTTQLEAAQPTSEMSLVKTNGEVAVTRTLRDPGFFGGDVPALGAFETTSGLRPSYTVTVAGFEPWDCPAGFDEEALAAQDEGCCLMHFESTGRIATQGIDPNALASTGEGRARFAEHRTRAGVVLGPFTRKGCSR
jgi:hypothetical protein